jgi:hypothetical protein
MAERQVLENAIYVRFVRDRVLAQRTPSLRTLAGHQVAFARVRAQYLAIGGYLKPLGHSFAGLIAFWTTHKSLKFYEKSAQYRCYP